MKASVSIAVAVIAALVLPSAASANWQYTQWGMSPGQVVTASRGAAHLEQDNGSYLPYLPRRDRALLLAKGEAQVANFAFKVGFYFDPQKRTLSSVFLSLGDCGGADASRLKELLSAKYGAPRERIYNLLTKWVSPFEPDMITLESSSCCIEYKPIPAGL